jgi:GTP-binding protein
MNTHKIRNEKLRNIAIIAHVDHGKTTLVDCLLKQSGIFRDNEDVGERILDSNDLERERGITILSKNTSVQYGDYTINIVDTPGHSDFGGEVERVLGMVNGALLLVDAAEGPMPQTRFVLSKALNQGIKVIVVVNKIDKTGADPDNTINKVFDLFVELTDNPDLIDFDILYANSVLGIAKYDLNDDSISMKPLFDTVVKTIEPPIGDIEAPFQFHVSSLDYNDYIGRIAIGRIHNGTVKSHQQINHIKRDGTMQKGKISKLIGFKNLKQVDIAEAYAGDIVGIAGFPDVQIGETLTHIESTVALPLIDIDEPTLQVNFCVNDSPFAGTEGKYVTSRQVRRRLYKELEKNVSMRVEDTENTDVFRVSGRGELHLGILIETMRREGYEFQVSKPKVIFKEINGKVMEPYENLFIDVPSDNAGTCIERLSQRKGQLIDLVSSDTRTHITFVIPARGLIGFRGEYIKFTKGEGIMYHTFKEFADYAGDIPTNTRGALVAHETGETIAYALQQLEDRGVFFVRPKTKVYRGMIVGENNRPSDLLVNVCKTKKLTNVRSTADVLVTLQATRTLSLEDCLEYIKDDELIEITPENIRLRKADIDNLKRM